MNSPDAASAATTGVTREPFGTTPDGEAVESITLVNASGTRLRAITLGGIITSLETRDRDGRLGDIVLGFDTLDGYLAHPNPYFGAIIGRYANRIAGGRFTLRGVEYRLATNNGANHLHGGLRGFDKIVWRAETFAREGERGVVLRHVSPDGDEGYPGTLHVTVTYTLTDADALVIDYSATTDRLTVVNLTQHSYFNLKGTGDVLDHVVQIDADFYTPVDTMLIPRGGLAPVHDTPFDLRVPTVLGTRIDAPHDQLRRAGGFDHNFVLHRHEAGELVRAARVHETTTGRTLEVRTTEPGVQLYTGNFLDGSFAGKRGVVYPRRGGLCLETQHFPNSPNELRFPTTMLKPGEERRSRTVFAFGVQS
ncbi:MAG TPA: aldose epimerase family protein [Gemmatimonadaceae bacterium]|nr:aldose epimerase family protein [Gemmatimonadaceae bacterium]